MKSKGYWAVELLILATLSAVLGQAQQAKLIARPSTQITATRGGSVSQNLNLLVLPGLHVNSDKPPDEFLIPLKLTWTGPLETKSITYPQPERVKVGMEMLTVFTGQFIVKTDFKVPQRATPGASEMIGKVRYQACNNVMCFRPSTLEVHVPVVIQ